MQFRTPIVVPEPPFQIGHADRVLLLGSCFTEHIGQRFQNAKISALTNPYGIAYNPVSMWQCLEALLEDKKRFTKQDLFEQGGLWRSWNHHSEFAHPDQTQSLTLLQNTHDEGALFLRNCTCVIMTPGTAFVYYLKETGNIVANNHKMPAALFGSRRLHTEEVVEGMQAVLEKLLAQYPHMKIVFTVSPVRHLRLGMIENQRSKAVLLLACERLMQKIPDRAACYFPAYELLMDDLRDYRFYAPDMVHPSESAVEYVWSCFSNAFFSDDTKVLCHAIERISTAARHRPFHPNTPGHHAFQEQQLHRIQLLQTQHPFLDFSNERAVFEAKNDPVP